MARNWTEHELLIAMNLYCKLPFGKLNHQNKLIVQVAEKMRRTPSSVSMKLCNLASFDPALQSRGVKGLRAASRADRQMWDKFAANWSEMSDKSEAAFDELMKGSARKEEGDTREPTGPSEVERTIKARRLQSFFRNAVLSSYEFECAVSGIAVPNLLIASHIIPWHEDESRRADPTNGLCLNALYDRAFDRGLITFDEDLRMVVSSILKKDSPPEFQQINFIEREGCKLKKPHRFQPDSVALQRHRERIFVA